MTETYTPNQKMEVHEINFQKGILNIGSHPENDVVVQDPNVKPFHLMIDLRQSPYLVISLNPEADITVNGVPLTDNETVEVADLSQVSFCGYLMNLIQKNGNNEGAKLTIISPEFDEETITAPVNVAPSFKTPLKPTQDQTKPIQTIKNVDYVPTSEVILVELHEQKQVINVEQTAIFPITIINGGSIVASFEVQVDGVPQEWVKITPERVNLNEGGRGRVEIQITPPRNSESRAGDYSLLIKVASSNYPGQLGGDRVELTINPYYEFSIGNLNPRYKTVSFRKNSAVTHYPIINQGNSVTNYLVMAQDDENGCKFEFQTQDEVYLAKQAELTVNPGEEIDVPVRITPARRHLVRLRPRQYQYNVTTQSMNEGAASRIVSGTFISKPLFGIFSVLMAVVLLLISAFFILRPRIMDFNVVEDVIALGDPAVLNWKVSPFTTNFRIEGVNQEISGSQNQIEVVPDDTAETYTLVAGNWLSRMLRIEDVRSKPITVLAIPPAPEISTFFVDKNRIFEGDDVTIKWSIANADEAYLTVDGVRTSLTPQEMNASAPVISVNGVMASLAKQEFNNERTVTLRNDTLIVLEAKNDSGTQFQSEFIHAQKPTIVIEEFSLSDTTIIKGEPVTIIWKVSGIGVENVMIAPFEEVYPLEGELTFFPEASMEFVLTVKNRDLEQIRLLPIGVLEPGAEPEPPTVEFFKVAPEEIVGSGAVEFSWSVSGIQDRIEISSIDGVVLADLPAQGFKSFNVSNTTSYVLTAYNGDLSSAAILEVKVNPTKKNAYIEINKIVPDTVINRGDSVMVYYSVYAANAEGEIVDPVALGWPEMSGSVVVTDGFDTCAPVDLPVHACELTLNTSEKNKQITATYSGDENYVRKSSAPYPVGIDVVGETAVFDATSMKVEPSSIVVGESAKISFVVSPENPAATLPITGKVRVLDSQDETLCIATLTAVTDKPMSAQGECLLTFNVVDNISFKLVYEGNDIYDGKITSGLTLAVNQANTVISLIANWSTPTVVGQSLPVEITVVPQFPGKGVPTGTFVIRDKVNLDNFCEGTLNSTGKGQCNLEFSTTGNRFVEAEFQGDINFRSSIYTHSEPHPVNKAATSTVITSFDPTTTTVGQEMLVKFKVSVIAPGRGYPTGSVTINAQNGNTCTSTLNSSGEGQCPVLLTKTGLQPVTATYLGDSSFQGSVGSGYSYQVSIAGTKTTILPPNPSPSAIGDSVNVSFTVSLLQTSLIKPNGTARVQASTGESCLATVTEGEGNCNLLFSNEGTRYIKVIYQVTTDYATSESAEVAHIVVRQSKTSIISTTLNPVVDQPVQIDFSVIAVTGGGGTPTGDVTITSDTNETCTGSLTNGSGNCSITFTKSGTKNLTATYQGNIEYKTSTSTPVYPVSIAKATTSTVITSNLSTTKFVGNTISVGVNVTSPIQATVTGNVTVSIVGSSDPRETCTLPLTNGNGSCDLTLIQTGSERQIRAVYEGTTDRFFTSTSTIVKQEVVPAPTTIIIKSDEPDPSIVNETVAFQVEVRANTLDTLRPSGTFAVILVDGSTETQLCTGSLDTLTSAGSCTYSFTNMGSKLIKAVYSGATNYAASSSVNVTHTVSKSDTTTNINIATNPSVLNQSIAVNVTVVGTGSSGIAPSGVVDISATKSGSSPKTCSITLNSVGTGSCNIAFNTVGDWTVTADYKGDLNFNISSKSLPQTVNKVESVTTITLPTAGSFIGQAFSVNISVAQRGSTPGSGALGGSVVVTATKSGATDRTCTINDISSGSGSCNLNLGVIGDWLITAVYSGNTDFLESSASSTHTVNKIPTLTTISVVAPATSVTGQPIAITVVVTRGVEFPGDIPTGAVKVSAVRSGGGSTECSPDISLVSGSVTCNLVFPSAGNWTITAQYLGTSTTFNESSANKAYVVSKADPAITIGFSTNSPKVGDPVTVTVNVNPEYEDGATPTGFVTVSASKSGSSPVTCSATIDLSNPSKTCTINLPSVGEWVIQASYGGDSNYISKSNTKNITVSQAETQINISGPLNNSNSNGVGVVVVFNVTAKTPSTATPTGTVNVTATAKTGSALSETCSPVTLVGGSGSCILPTLSRTDEWTITAKFVENVDYKSSETSIKHNVVFSP